LCIYRFVHTEQIFVSAGIQLDVYALKVSGRFGGTSLYEAEGGRGIFLQVSVDFQRATECYVLGNRRCEFLVPLFLLGSHVPYIALAVGRSHFPPSETLQRNILSDYDSVRRGVGLALVILRRFWRD
jgi:hypothetical protein